MSTHFDLIAIGAGSGGLSVVEKAASYGKRCAVVESRDLGGTCVNRGCVPKKVMWNAANLVHHAQAAQHYGFKKGELTGDWQQLKKRRDKYVNNIVHWYGGYLADKKIEPIIGHASFIDDHTIVVNHQQYTADHIVIAVGTLPVVPKVPGGMLGITSDGFFDLPEQPHRVAIVGSGYIAVEIAGVLQTLGSEVSLIIRGDTVLSPFDVMLQKQFTNNLQQQGIQLWQNTTVAEIHKQASNEKSLINQRGETLGTFDTVIWAVGRKPQLNHLGLENTGVVINDTGYIQVDEHHETSVAGIYALGDVIGKVTLTPVAIAAGRQLANRLYHPSTYRPVNYDLVPSVMFSHPPIASIGLTEQQARDQYPNNVKVYQTEFTPMVHAFDVSAAKTALKLVVHGSEEKIIGCHMIGEGVDEILQGFAVAITMGACKQDFDNTIAIHPTSAEELVTMR